MTATETAAIVVAAPAERDVAVVPLEPPGPDDVLIATHYSGVSTGTDTWVMRGVFEWDRLTFPLVPGYQRSGIVEAAGDAAAAGSRSDGSRPPDPSG